MTRRVGRVRRGNEGSVASVRFRTDTGYGWVCTLTIMGQGNNERIRDEVSPNLGSGAVRFAAPSSLRQATISEGRRRLQLFLPFHRQT